MHFIFFTLTTLLVLNLFTRVMITKGRGTSCVWCYVAAFFCTEIVDDILFENRYDSFHSWLALYIGFRFLFWYVHHKDDDDNKKRRRKPKKEEIGQLFTAPAYTRCSHDH